MKKNLLPKSLSFSFASRLALAALMFGSSLIGCTTLNRGSTPLAKREVAPGPRVSVMSFNAENLFDNTHDEGKDDYTYLPLAVKQATPAYLAACEQVSNNFHRKECLETDWNDEVLSKKLGRVAEVIQQVNDGRGPDIQVLIEVENKNVLEMLRSRLTKSDYKTSILLEGPDKRGIDPAILSRLPEWDKPRLHIIPLKARTKKDEYPATYTRGILEARLVLPDGQKIAFFAIHLPSQQNPAYLREQAVAYINQLKKELPPDVLAMGAGDFNISSEEDEELGFFSKTLASEWAITHKIGCKGCEGTHYYRPGRSWSFLDAILFTDAMTPAGGAKWKVDAESIRTPNQTPHQMSKWATPLRWDENAEKGVSDHWPIYAEIYKPLTSAASK
jgi:hypothetical protein